MTTILLSSICPLSLSHVPGCSACPDTLGPPRAAGSSGAPCPERSVQSQPPDTGMCPRRPPQPSQPLPARGPRQPRQTPELSGPRGTSPGPRCAGVLAHGDGGARAAGDQQPEARRIGPTQLSPCGRSVPVVARGPGADTSLVQGLPVLPAMDEQRPSRRPMSCSGTHRPGSSRGAAAAPSPGAGADAARDRPPPVRPRRPRTLPGRVSPTLTVARADRVPGE